MSKRFDDITRVLASPLSRRQALKLVVAILGGATMARLSDPTQALKASSSLQVPEGSKTLLNRLGTSLTYVPNEELARCTENFTINFSDSPFSINAPNCQENESELRDAVCHAITGAIFDNPPDVTDRCPSDCPPILDDIPCDASCIDSKTLEISVSVKFVCGCRMMCHTEDDAQVCTCVPTSATSVEVTHFAATTAAGAISLTWATSTEQSNLGFNLYRAPTAGDLMTRVNATLIPAKGSATSGATYTYTDTAGAGHFVYSLQNVDQQGLEHLRAQVEVQPSSRDIFLPFLRSQ